MRFPAEVFDILERLITDRPQVRRTFKRQRPLPSADSDSAFTLAYDAVFS